MIDNTSEFPQEPAGPEPQHKSSFKSMLLEAVKTLALALVLYVAISAMTDRVRVENISMQPTLYEGELLVVYKQAYLFGEPHRGDVIVFHHSSQPPEDYIKRVIGLPGDSVDIYNGQVSINGQVVDEPYINAEAAYQGSWEVPEGMLFVLGDNRNRSSDSHTWGFVPQEDVVGRAVFIYWPLNSISLLSHTDIVQASQ